MEKNYYFNLVKILKNKIRIEKANGIQVLIKEIPDSDKDGILDPRVYKTSIQPKDNTKSKQDNYIVDGYNISEIRKSMGSYNTDITNREINTEYRTVTGENGDIDIRVYLPLTNVEKMPCVIFFHGGSFIGGTLDVVENPCKAISDKANSVVISVDYRLAPENPYPKGFIDCFDVVKYVYNNPKEFNIDNEKICVSGDSAGGNLAALCSLRDRDEKSNIIKYQALIYPLLILTDNKGTEYDWNISQYNMQSNVELIKDKVTALMDNTMIKKLYLKGEDPEYKYISPLLENNFSNLPKTLVITAEYDFLRVQDEVYVKNLIDAGVDAKNIRYNGVNHAFIDKCGLYPQAEDCFDEIAKDINMI
ncbi:alpha/beta hydrolase [Clostridium sp. ZBS15]|uniref:alpha/beta hydrolase n=1 Tax=Clostridium sp. ZBS15 TaxID=2949969 RepID=UPI00207A8C3B|nr:alpha/beta hydrolase [Clostridium sp. ZBS15]